MFPICMTFSKLAQKEMNCNTKKNQEVLLTEEETE